MKKSSRNDQETGSWYLLEVLVKVLTSTPNPFSMGVPPRLSLHFLRHFWRKLLQTASRIVCIFFFLFKIYDNMTESYTAKPVLSGHPWETHLCLLNTGCPSMVILAYGGRLCPQCEQQSKLSCPTKTTL